MAIVGAMIFQAGTNLINDYYDWKSGVDTFDLLSPEAYGPSLAIQRELLTPDQVWWGGIACFAAGSVLGLILTYLRGWPILLIGVLAILCGYFYTATPISLAYIAMGDIASFLFLGPAVSLGTYYAIARKFAASAAIASLPAGALSSGILQVNNIRDIERDPVHGKRTLASRVGREGAIRQLLVYESMAYTAILCGVLAGALPLLCLIAFASLRHVVKQIRILTRERSAPELNVAMMESGQAHIETCALLTLALLISAALGW
jgi:1,4-dihydroxy-2-naphthoate octaprenyltransferase